MTEAKTLFEPALSDPIAEMKTIPSEQADRLFSFFRDCPLFRWQDCNNDCEDRANAICMLLDEWKIPNYKAWVFSGPFLKGKRGSLVNCWNYHVAATVLVDKGADAVFYVLDPATLLSPGTIENWAEGVTGEPVSYYLIKFGYYYIFPSGPIYRDNWFVRDRRNYKWTIQGVSGINGVSRTGKAQLVFRKRSIRETEQKFRELMRQRPAL